MSKIYATFSNPGGDLTQVTSEFSELIKYLTSDKVKHRVDFGFELNPTVQKITSDITEGQKDIRVFLFSGHSGGSGLDFGKDEFNTEYLVRFFNTLSSDDSKIDCVILNGCDNAEIVRRLSHVPVVIGTRSKINDDVAKKFTNDFFNALIGSEASYKQSFVDAIAAQNNISSSIHTRSEGGGDVPEGAKLNDYFMYINEDEVAKRTFPFKKGKPNFAKYIFIAILMVAGLLGFMYRHEIEQMIRGYSCALITNSLDHSKCNFVIADFTTEQGANLSDWLEENLITSSEISTYLNCINIKTFSSIIKDKAVDRDQMPGLCGYDFHVTGSYTTEQDRYRAEFNIFPFDPDQLSSSTFVYHVESLGNLDTLITFLDKGMANQFVLFELCATCAVQKGLKEILPSMVALAGSYQYDSTTAPSFQRIQQRLSDAALHVGDTMLALKALDQVAAASPNDFALWALEEKAKIYEVQQDIPNHYVAQTAYLQAMELRLQPAALVEKDESQATYLKASNQIRLHRAGLVTDHDDELKEKRTEAIKDYEKVDRVKYRDRINVLKSREASAFSGAAVIGVQELEVSPSATSSNPGGGVATADGFVNPSAVLYKPALIDPGIVTKLNTGFILENNLVEQLRVAVLTHPKEEKTFQHIKGRLTEFGYKVDQKLSRMDLDENSRVLKAPTVIFYHPDKKVKAYHLGRMLSKEFNKEFQVLSAEEISAQRPIFRNSDMLDLAVYWE